jgi:transcriptional antiterminator RfaH
MFVSTSTAASFGSEDREDSRAASTRPLLAALGLGWFCLRGEGRREHVAALNLAHRTQIEAFAPRIRTRRQSRSGGIATTTEALFPGYLFARFKYPEQVRRVVSTTGVVGLVSFGGPPPRLADQTIDFLRQHAAPATLAPLSPIFEEGDWVRIAGGCFQGTEGKVRGTVSGLDRVCVLLSVLGHEVEVSLPIDQVLRRRDLPDSLSVNLRAVGAASLIAAA